MKSNNAAIFVRRRHMPCRRRQRLASGGEPKYAPIWRKTVKHKTRISAKKCVSRAACAGA